jgi:cytochrome P450
LIVATGLLLAVGALAWWWRTRDAYGASRGLPPGSLGVSTTFRSLLDSAYYARSAARYGAVFKSAQFHRSVVCIADLPLALDVLEQHASSLGDPHQPFGRRSPRQSVSFLTDESHPRHRPLLNLPLLTGAIEMSRSAIAETIEIELANAVVGTAGSSIDPRPLMDRIASRTLYQAVFGLRAGDPRIDTLHAGLVAVGTHRPESRVDGVRPLIDAVQSSGRDLLSGATTVNRTSILGTLLLEDSRCLDDTTLLGNLALIVLVTRNNVRLTITWILKELLDHPAVMNEVRHGEAPGLAENVVRETWRRHVSEFMYRETLGDIPVGRYLVPRGWLIRVCVREAHDDASVFPDPHEFRPSRFSGGVVSPRHFRPGSDGTNSAIGAELAFMIATEFVRVVAKRWEGEITADGPAERSGWRHWKHWEPSPRLRVRLTPR